jgi:hypothetical protein
MTRDDENGWVTFWEPMNGKLYHLPRRWTPDKTEDTKQKHKKKAKKGEEDAAVDELLDEAADGPPELVWEGEAEDAKIEAEDIDALPTTRRQPKAKSKVGRSKETLDISKQKKEEAQKKLESQTFAPYKEFLEERNLVNYLPYDSIDVIFNEKNLWANHQNHNPALIKYDLPDKDHPERKNLWLPYLDSALAGVDDAEVKPLGDRNVSLAKALDSDQAMDLRRNIVNELKENLRLYRSKLGFDCTIEKDEVIMKQLEDWLTMQELASTIDLDALNDKAQRDHINLKEETIAFLTKYLLPKAPFHNKRGTIFMSSDFGSNRVRNYREENKKRFKRLEKMIEAFNKNLEENFQVKRNKEFDGFTVHFSTSDVDDMRERLMNESRYKELINVTTEDIVYAIACNVYPLPAGVQSIWVFIGAQQKIKETKEEKGFT